MLEAAVRPDEEVGSSSVMAGEGLRQLDTLLAAARSLVAAYAGEAAPGPPLAPAQPGAASLDPSALASARKRYMAASSGLRATLQRMDARQQQERAAMHKGDAGGSVELEEVQARVRELRARVAERNTAVKALADHFTALADDLSLWESTL